LTVVSFNATVWVRNAAAAGAEVAKDSIKQRNRTKAWPGYQFREPEKKSETVE
jgi:hypothetical protein